jgi:hypothetical protein
LRGDLTDTENQMMRNWDERVGKQDEKLNNINHLLNELKEVRFPDFLTLDKHANGGEY